MTTKPAFARYDTIILKGKVWSIAAYGPKQVRLHRLSGSFARMTMTRGWFDIQPVSLLTATQKNVFETLNLATFLSLDEIFESGTKPRTVREFDQDAVRARIAKAVVADDRNEMEEIAKLLLSLNPTKAREVIASQGGPFLRALLALNKEN